MKRLMTLLAGALCAFAVFAGDITADQARTVAENFTTKDAIGKSVLPDRTVDTVVKRGGFYLVTLKPSGHILVSVNRSARPIPVFSGSDFVEPAVGSPQAAFLLAAETNSVNATGTQYETQWKTLLGQRVLRLTTSSTTEYVNIAPMVTTSWDQNYPYNDLMPIINRSATLVGCVATAYSQILRYWEWPEVLDEDIVTEHSVDAMWGHKWRLKAGTIFDWADMPASGGYDYATRLKLGRGAMFAGMLARMTYNTAASGTQTARPGQNHWYTPYTCLDTSNSTLEQREEGMKQSLKNGCPFMVSVNYGTIGHAVVGDGWQESASGKYVHLNYGWGFNNSYYATTEPLGVYLNSRPRPMVMNKPLPASSTLPVKVEWSFPVKGYETTLNDFRVSYTEVEEEVADWTDDMSVGQGTIEGACISVETVDATGHGNVMRIGTKADDATYTWPTMVATKDTVFSYDIHSWNALGMVVEIQLLDPSVGWISLATPKIGERSEIEWTNHSIDLGQYAGKGIAIRVKAARTGSSSYNDDTSRATGVQFDNIRLTSVRQPKKTVAGTSTAAKGVRSLSINDAALVSGKTYLFQVTPTFSDANIEGVPSYLASCKIVGASVAKPTITSVTSVRSGAPAVQNNLYRECYFGLNQFGVYGSEATTKLEAYLSNLVVIGEVQEEDACSPGTMITTHNKVSIEDAVTYERKSPGNFLVKVDASKLTAYLNGAGMILTLVARNDQGDVAQKDVFLKFTKTGSEQELAIADLPENGGTVAPDEPEPVYYTVTFNANGGTGGTSRQVLSGDTISTFPSVSWSGHTLEGWFTAGGTRVYESQVISGAVTYYAHWLTDTTPVDPGEDPVDPPSGGDDPIIDPTSGNANDFTEGGKTYRFCNGVNKTSGCKDVNRVGYYAYQAPGAYSLVLWWADAYKAAKGSYPTGYVAPSTNSFPSDGTKVVFPTLAMEVFQSAVSTAIPSAADRAEYFPTVAYTSAQWCGDTSGDAAVKAAGRRIYAMLNNGPIGILVPTSSTRSYGGVIWGCEYATDSDGKYATVLYITSTKSNNDNLENYTLANVTVSGVGTMPGLKSFNSNGGVIQTYYPIVGPAVSEEPDEPVTPVDPDEPDEPVTPVDPDDPDTPVDPDEPDTPVVPGDEPIAEASDDGNPGKSYLAEYGYEMYDNYWTARKRAIKQGKQLFILSGAAWCSNCSFVKNYLTSLGTDFSNRFVVYYSDNDSTTCNCFRGGLPQYGAADPRAVDAFTGTLNGSVRSWDIAWQTDTSGIYQQDRGGYAPGRVDLVVAKGKERAPYSGLPTALVIRGLPTLGTGTTGRYELFAQFEDGTEMPVDYGVDWEVVSGNGTFSDAHVDGRDVGALVIASGSVVIRARSTFYFTGTKTMTVECAPESDIASVEILTSEVNLEDDATPTIEAEATLTNGKKIPVFGFGTWTATFKRQLPRSACPELEENSYQALHPTITVDSASKLNYARGASDLLEVCDQEIDVTLTVNGKTATKTITVWGPTKVIASKWTMVSGDRQTTLGVVRLNCTELTYNYGGEIKTTADTYFASYATVLKSGIYSQTSYLRGLTVFVDNYSSDKTYTVDLKAQKVNGKYKGYTPDLFTQSSREISYTSCARGSYVTGIEKGMVPQGFFKAFWPNESSGNYAALADVDSDGDGFLNWQEYVLGTDPTNAGDAFTLMQGYQHLTAPAANGATMQYKVMYQQRAGRTYYIDAKKAWGDDWTHVATVDLANLNANAVTTFKDLKAEFADQGMFFRVRAALSEQVSTYMADAPVIAPNMLVANRGAVIDLTNAQTLPPLNLTAFDTDATDPGTVWVKVAPTTAPGTKLISAPKSAQKSLEACQPKDSGDIQFEVVEDPDNASRMILRVKPVAYKAPFMFFITQDTNWSDIDWTDANGRVAKWSELGDATQGAEVTLEANSPFVVTVDTAVSASTVNAGANVTLKFNDSWPSQVNGACTIELGDTNAGASRNISACVASTVFADGFTGTLKLGKGRYNYTAGCLPTNVKIVVEDGAQLFVSDNVTIANAVTISGNGWGGETGLAVSKAAIRLGNNAVMTGALMVAGDAKIGVHGSNSASLNGAVSGSGNLTKWAGGTLLVGSVGSGLGGRFTVGQGTVKANASSVNFFGCGTDAKAIIVESGAAFDMNGKHSADLTIALNGGKLTNTASGIDSGKKTLRKIILTDDSRLEGSYNYGLIAHGYGKAYLDLRGHTLTFAMNSGKDFWLPNVEVTDGTIDVVSGRFYTWKTMTTFAGTVKVSGGEFKVQGPATVDSLVLAGGSVTDSAALTINGTIRVEATTTINRAFALGNDAKVNLPLDKTLTVPTAQQIAAAKFVVPEGYVAKETAGSGTYSYLAKLMQVDFTPNASDATVVAEGDATTGLKIDHKWLREKTAAHKWTGSKKPTKPIEVTSTSDDIAEVLNSTGENGAKVWESYVLGLDPAVAESKPVVVPVQSASADKITLKVGNVDVNTEAGANSVTYKIVYSDSPNVEAGSEVAETTTANVGEAVEVPLPTSGVRYYQFKVFVD